MDIIFTNIAGIPEEYSPKPASKFVPEWYKNLDSYMNGEKKPTGEGNSAATIKKCMPVFDAITTGYIIVSPADIYVSQKDDGNGSTVPYYEWSNYGLIQFHPVEQAPSHPNRNGLLSYPKWINHWGIKTPKGYSLLIVQPFHRESVFTILPGIVDTDSYVAAINFPFVLNDPKFEGIIPAGTPIAQVIPIKRESWNMSFGNEKELKEINNVNTRLLSKFFDRYKDMFRSPKEYK
jgi:hypothetical protein